jgi:hypothetical protein
VSENNGQRSDVIAQLRSRPGNVLLFRGFGPAAVGAVLLALMLWLAPSVAPEHVVEKPVHETTTTNPVINR